VVFIAAEDRSPIDADADRFARITTLALVILGGGLIAAVVVQVRVGLLPLFRLRREVASVRRGKAEKLEGEYPEELEPLAVELNALLSHNQEVVERQRTHVGNLAHALKTPLSVMLTEAGQQPGSLAEVVERQAQTMREQVDHHLRRARAAARSQTSGERTAGRADPGRAGRHPGADLPGQGRGDRLALSDDLCFQGERQDFMELAGNVMENAGKWCKSKVRAFGRGQLARADDPDRRRRRSRACRPTAGATPSSAAQRMDEHTPGSGLGLSIVDELARAYGGSVSLGASPLGGLEGDPGAAEVGGAEGRSSPVAARVRRRRPLSSTQHGRRFSDR
jgi:signal transduction histidine kinase